MPHTDADGVVVVNVLVVEPEKQGELLDLLRENTQSVVETLTGWRSTTLIASRDATRVVIHSRWDSAADAQAMRTNPLMLAYFPRIRMLASFESITGDVAFASVADRPS